MNNNDGVNTGRRTFLVGASCAVAAVGTVAAAVPFVKSWEPSARALNAGAPVKVDISKLAIGGRIIVEWRGQPVWVVARSQKILDGLKAVNPLLLDPDSNANQQPPYAKNIWRSIKPEYLVMIGICTHLGCSPTYLPVPSKMLEDGGYHCPCHGSLYDPSGRVYKDVPAPLNMVVPPHSYLSDTVIIVGSEEGRTKA
jgi:ubiquinol-cytochrome c reductase iron-sulfur subunit